MKSKKKFDPKVIQQFFIDHTEKLVIGLVALLFLFFAYNSCTLNFYDKKPDDLKKATDKALANINNGPGGPNIPTTIDYAEEIDKFKTPVDPGEYPTQPSFNWRPIPPRRLRGMPEVFPVEHLQAVSGRGALTAGMQDSSATRGTRWIVVTGLVPYKKQFAEYRAKFEGAAWNNPLVDVPKYDGYFVQRAEVIPGSEPKWSTFTVFNGSAVASQVGRNRAEELADPRFVKSTLTAPLPLLVGATWGAEAVSLPQIPVVEHAKAAGEGSPPGQTGGGMPARGEANPNQQVGAGLAGNLGGAPGIDAGGPNLLEPQPAKPTTESAAPKDELALAPEYLLLRFLDFDVKPNKQYAYRIFLVLENPNRGLQADVLEEGELAELPFIGAGAKGVTNEKGDTVDWPTYPKYAKWSPPCPAVRVSGDIRLLGGPVVAARSPVEINAEVRVLLWLEQSGLNGSFSKDGLIRGTILNFPGSAVRTPGETRTTRSDLTLNSILVDLQGGESLPDKEHHLTSPGLILVMDDSGNLVIHDEVAEAKEWQEARKQTERREPPVRPGRGRGRSRGRAERETLPDIDPVPTKQGKAGGK